MRRVLAIVLTQLRLTAKSKGALATMFGMPLGLIVIFGLLIGGGSGTPRAQIYPVAVVDEDQSLASTLLIESLQAEESLAIRTTTPAEVDRLIANARVAASLVIPHGFATAMDEDRSIDLELTTLRSSNLGQGINPILRRSLRQFDADYRLARQMAGATGSEASIRSALEKISTERAIRGAELAQREVAAPTAEGPTFSALTWSGLSFTVMSVMMSILLMAGTILYERQHGTWGRLLTTPTSRLTLLIGYLLSYFITGMLQFLLLVVGTRLLFGLQWGPWLPLLAVGAATVLAAAGVGLMLAGLVRTYEQQQTVGVVLVIATSMLGGLFWPLEIMSPTMQRIGHLTPQAWAMQGLTEVALRGGQWANLVWPLTVLLSLAAIFTTAGLLRVRYE